MSELSEVLASLGLEQYHEGLISEGFDTWETVQDITETDLDALNFKLGHRRKLQRYIASQRGINLDQPLVSPHPEVTGDRGGEGSVSTEGQADRPTIETKRKYRRHPKPDENAPERPPSAYVLFSNHIREEIKGKDLSFTDIAKLVGQRWQALSTSEREPYETRAANLKEVFSQQLAEYKKSDEYRQYTQYLAEFRAKHGGGGDGKRPKLEEEISGGSGGSPIVPTLSSASKMTESADATGTRQMSHSQALGTARSAANAVPQAPRRLGSFEAPGHPTGPQAEHGPTLATRLRGAGRTPPDAVKESGGYFDPLARHNRLPSTSSHQSLPPPTAIDTGQQPPQGQRPPPLAQEPSGSSLPSTLSYGSASSGLPWTPQTPRDDPPTSAGSKGTPWEASRPILPPFQASSSHSFSGLQPLKMPDRGYGHAGDPSLRLPPPMASLSSGPPDPRGHSIRAPPLRPHFSEQNRSITQREDSSSKPESSRGGERREESGIDLLARAINAEQRDRGQS